MKKKNNAMGYILRLLISAAAASSLIAGNFVVSQVMQLVLAIKWGAQNPGGTQAELVTYLNNYFTDSSNLLLVITIRSFLIAIATILIIELGMKWRAFGNPIKAFPKLTFPGTLASAMGLELVISCCLLGATIIAPDAMAGYGNMIAESGLAGLTVISTIATLIAAPLVEELIFRGLILKVLERGGFNFWVANVIQAIFFGLIHMNIVQGIYAFFMGFLFGLLYKKTGKLWACILAHAVFNAFGTYGVAYIFGHAEGFKDLILPFIVGLVAVAAGVVMIFAGKEQGKED